MPQLTQSVPRYRKHRASGQAIVSISGQDHYLGPHGTRASKVEYDRLIAEWLVGNRQPHLSEEEAKGLTVAELLARYWQFAKRHYRKRGQPTRSLDEIRAALIPLRRLYSHTRAADFGPRSLKAIRQQYVERGVCRIHVNKRAGIVRRVFKWGVSEELVPPSVYHGLLAVSGLQKGRTEAPDHAPVGPVDDATVDATIPFLPPVVDDMIRLQRLTGCRPEEVCILRPCDLDRSGPVWEYRPEHHKTEHHDRDRIILIGPKAQEVLMSYLLRPTGAYCFVPAESDRKRKATMRDNRKTKVQPSQIDRSKRKPARPPGDFYTSNNYARAVNRAVDLANRQRRKEAAEAKARGESVELVLLSKWSPNRLRHSAATRIRKRYGLEAAQVILGHSKADVTQVYAERDADLARRVIAELG